MNLKHSIKLVFLLSLVLFYTSNLLADDVKSGEKLFKQNCTACHMISDARLVGPGLKGVTDKYEREWLIKWAEKSTGTSSYSMCSSCYFSSLT